MQTPSGEVTLLSVRVVKNPPSNYLHKKKTCHLINRSPWVGTAPG